MKRGSKPHLSLVKAAKGNPAGAELNDNPPTPEGAVERPAFVKGAARKLWDKYAPALEAQGVLTAWDAENFGIWACLMADFQKDPKAFVTARMTQLRLLGECFGMTGPSSRERIKIAPKADKEDPAKEFYG